MSKPKKWVPEYVRARWAEKPVTVNTSSGPKTIRYDKEFGTYVEIPAKKERKR